MAGYADLRRFGLAFPGVSEHLHMRDQPSLRVRGKMFAVWWAPDKTTIMKLDREHQLMLFEVRPDVFAPCRVGTGTWSYVDVGKLTRAELKALVREAWSQVAPKTLRDATSSAAATSRPARRSKPAAATGTGVSAPFPSRRRRR
jgi:hypothetical protein